MFAVRRLPASRPGGPEPGRRAGYGVVLLTCGRIQVAASWERGDNLSKGRLEDAAGRSGVIMTAGRTRASTRLARRLGLDGNPLRRRSDVIAGWLMPAAVLAFLALSPAVYALTNARVHADDAAARRAERSWHRVTGIVLAPAPGAAQAGNGASNWTVTAPVQWTVSGQTHTADLPVPAATAKGSHVPVWLDQAGKPEIPLTAVQAGDRAIADTLVALAALAVALAGLAWLGRRILDRRRLAGWEVEWLAVGPRWSRRG
jgi:hypothetical protein